MKRIVFNRRYRNRRIGEFLKEMHLAEGRNSGFRKILNALERNGSPKPIFETDPEILSSADVGALYVAPQPYAVSCIPLNPLMRQTTHQNPLELR